MARSIRVRPFIVVSCILMACAAGVSSVSHGEPKVWGRGPGSPPATPVVAKTKQQEQSSGTFVDKMSAQGQRARGLYITYPYLHLFKAKGVAGMITRSRMDAAVVDLKDDQGRISYTTKVAAFQPQIVGEPIDMPAAVAELKQAGVYTIAR